MSESLSFPHLLYLVINYILYIILIIQCVTKYKGVKFAVCLGSIFIKTFYLSMFLNNTVRVWPFKYVSRLINIYIYIYTHTHTHTHSHRQFILSNRATFFGLYINFQALQA